MQPPIPIGTLLNSRYRLEKILGQGGFGRTYLAGDQGRFNERCVVKEYIPIAGDDYALQKSRELFQREASTLYQIQHPQIPQFRELFEQGQRLFFVQDFVEGQTYGALLAERLRAGQTFTEAEIMHLMEQILPVLAHIHNNGIVHRDISPDNLILRDQDHCPVLIDFGVVKEIIAGQLQPLGSTQQGTTVGKLGYSPSEQLQTGKVYPNSDIYALAVTVVVLMTGKQPQDLLDEATMTWHWQQWVPALSPRLVQVLNRMMSPRPHNRYQSATEVLQALRSLTGLVQTSAAPGSPSTETLPPRPVATKPKVTLKTSSKSSDTQLPKWLGWGLGGTILLAIALAPWVVVNNLLTEQKKQMTASPSVTPSPTASPPPVSSLSPTSSPTTTPASPGITGIEAVVFGPQDTVVQKTGEVNLGQSKTYLLSLGAGQILAAQVLQGGVTIEVRDPIGVILASNTSAWQSQPTMRPGNYQITVTATQRVNFSLAFTLTQASPIPGVTPPTPPATPPTGIVPSLPLPSPTAIPSPSPTSPSPQSPSPRLVLPISP